MMCQMLGVSRSGYYDYLKRAGAESRDEELAEQIRQCQERSHHTYGYRRVHQWLKQRNVHRNPKTILRIMQKYGLLSEIRRRRKWVQMGQQVHKYQNLLDRKFLANRPNSKWVTDISYIHTKEGACGKKVRKCLGCKLYQLIGVRGQLTMNDGGKAVSQFSAN